MKSFHEWYMEREPLNEAAKKADKKADKKKGQSPSSSRVKGMGELVDALRKFFQQYDLPTRQFLWDRLTTAKGKEMLEKVLRNPRSPISNSSFVQLVTTSKK